MNGTEYSQHSVIVFENTEVVQTVTIEGRNQEAGLILLSGLPIGEKVAWHGPFVMNTNDQISETFEDLSNYRNGFENARNWESEIQQLRFK